MDLKSIAPSECEGSIPSSPTGCVSIDAGWSSLEARRAHNPEVVGSNPTPATNFFSPLCILTLVDFYVIASLQLLVTRNDSKEGTLIYQSKVFCTFLPLSLFVYFAGVAQRQERAAHTRVV